GDYVWVEVEPIKWLVSEKDKLMLAEKIVFAGVQFKHERDYHTKDFGKTDIKKFIDECWSKDIEQVLNEKSKENENGQEKGKIKKTRLQKLRPKQGEEDIGNKDITETERIHRWIENGESVMLIGPSGIGKTERIESLYPDYIRLELSDGMLPEIVKGSVNIQTGKNIPPTYAVKAIKQMATEEEKKLIEEDIQNIYKIADDIYKRSKKEDKKIVILIDELLNVKPQIQGLVYPLVLKNIVPCGSGEEIKLPLNVVLVGTGNPEKFSSIGKEMPEPLRKRFYHVRKMEAKVGEWLTEYAIPNSVHPSVIGYIMSKYYESGKSEKKEDIQYFYEDPEVGEDNRDEYGQVGATNDPRSWTQVSDIIKNFEKDLEQGKFSQYTDRQIEEELKKGLEDKLRIEWLSSFMDFYNNPTLTPEEVVEAYTKDEEGNVKFKINQADLPQDINERFAFMTALISADEKQVKVCRDFIRKYCDPEYLATFDIAWAGKDERRARKIDELQTLDELNAKTYNGDDTRSYVRDGMEGFEAIDLAYNEHQRNEGRGGK
ncbi:MAG: AAA family ATPase, partial [Clostridia bacterium]|nr:AAA family ATPase [Clostridia bacterium]